MKPECDRRPPQPEQPSSRQRLARITAAAGLALTGLWILWRARWAGSSKYPTRLRHSGLAAPAWLPQWPGLVPALTTWRQTNLADPKVAEQLLGRALTAVPIGIGRELGSQIDPFSGRLLKNACTSLSIL